MRGRLQLVNGFAWAIIIAAGSAYAASEAPWQVGRTSPPWASIAPERTLQLRHDPKNTDQGDGIEVKQGSHDNWIYRNHVHDTNYPCIIAYGTGGSGLHVIEQNICYWSNDNELQVQGEAIVRNNLLMAAAGAGFASTDHQGKTTHLTFVHNTIISRRRGANLSSWNDRQGMVFANNAVYTDRGDALRFPHGAKGVSVSGNVLVGQVSGVEEGFTVGNDLTDFASVSWDGARRAATPVKNSSLIGRANVEYVVAVDIRGNKRGRRVTAAAFDAP